MIKLLDHKSSRNNLSTKEKNLTSIDFSKWTREDVSNYNGFWHRI